MPKGSRLPKHMFPPPNRGPYTVHGQPDQYNLILKGPSTGELVDEGRKIPLDQILAGPRRSRLYWADVDDSDVRPMSKLLDGNRNASAELTREFYAGRRRGWGPLPPGSMVAYQTIPNGPQSQELTIGRVLVNDRERLLVILQPYDAHWHRTKIIHRPYYQTPYGYSLVPTPHEARVSVRYEALVMQVELYPGSSLQMGVRGAY